MTAHALELADDPFDALRPVSEGAAPRPTRAHCPFDDLEPVPETPEMIAERKALEAAERRRAEDDLERLVFHMPAAAQLARTQWQRDFAAGLAAKAKRRGWRPTARQKATMESIVGEMFGDDDCVVIQGEGGATRG